MVSKSSRLAGNRGMSGSLALLGSALLTLVLLTPAASPLGPGPASALSYVVTTAADPAIAVGLCTPANCTLRQAIADANATPADDTITFAAGVSDIVLNPALGQLEVSAGSGKLTVDGTSVGGITIDGGNASRVIQVNGGELHLIRVTVTRGFVTSGGGTGIRNDGGSVTLTTSTVRGNQGSGNGAGVLNLGGTVTVLDSEVTDNTASGGNRGGGVFNDGGQVSLTNSTVSRNTATSTGGGGLYNSSNGTTTLTNSTVHDNDATGGGSGGGIRNDGGQVSLTNSTVSDNMSTGQGGGGIRNSAGTLTLLNSTVTGNEATGGGGGGGIRNDGNQLTLTGTTVSGNQATGQGGGILNDGGPAVLTNSTVSGNIVGGGGNGGAIRNNGSQVALTNVTIVHGGNVALTIGSAGTTTLRNTIIARLDGSPACSIEGSGTYSSLGNNLATDLTCGLVHVDDPAPVPAVALLLGPLADNGGPTFTHALLPLSPALNAGNNTVCTQTVANGGSGPNDQRGPAFLRSFGPSCDIGAFELQPVGKLRLTKALQPSGDAGKFDLLIDGLRQTPFGGVGDGGAISQVIVPAGPHAVSETLVSGAPSPAHYFTTIACRSQNGAGPQVASGTGALLSVTVAQGAEVACVFTNTRVPEQCLGMVFDRAVVGALVILGSAGRDLLVGSDGNDVITGGAGNDCIDGRGGNDTLLGDAGDDVIIGGPGFDTITGGAGSDRLHGGPGNDVLIGNDGNDKLYGGLNGAGAAGELDQLDGSAGTDLCQGTIRVRCEQ